jgi:hypothetical protein
MPNISLAYSFGLSVALHLVVLMAPDWRNYPVHAGAEFVERAPIVAVLGRQRSIYKVVAEKLEDTDEISAEADVAQPEATRGGQTAVSGSRSLDDYLPPSRLSQVPFPRNEISEELRFKGFEGLVGEAEIMVLISSEGEVDDILLLDSTLPAFLVEKAIARFREVKFVPGVQGSMSVRSRVRIRLTPPAEDQLLGNPYSAKEKAWRR